MMTPLPLRFLSLSAIPAKRYSYQILMLGIALTLSGVYDRVASGQTPPPVDIHVGETSQDLSYDRVIILAIDRESKKIIKAEPWYRHVAHIQRGYGQMGRAVIEVANAPGLPILIAAAWNAKQIGPKGRVNIDLYLDPRLDPGPRNFLQKPSESPAQGFAVAAWVSRRLPEPDPADIALDSAAIETGLPVVNDPFGGAMADPFGGTLVPPPWDTSDLVFVNDSVRQHVWKQLLSELLQAEGGVGAEAEKIVAVLREVLSEECATETARRELELQAIETQLQKLRGELNLRQENQDRIVDAKLSHILLSAQGLLAD